MKLNSKISVIAAMSAALFSATASSADFSNITTGTAQINVAEKSVVLMNITPQAGLVSGLLKGGSPVASFLASSSNSNGFVAVRWAGSTMRVGNDTVWITSQDQNGGHMALRLVAPDLKYVEGNEWFSNNKSRIDGQVVLSGDQDIKAGIYTITLDAASYTL